MMFGETFMRPQVSFTTAIAALLLCCCLQSADAQTKRTLSVNPAPGAKRLALVIGNDSYKSVTPLHNARADARAIARALGSGDGCVPAGLEKVSC